MEVIPFKVFVAGSIYPSTGVLSAVDGGLTFFVGTGVALLALVVAEKMGLNVNKGAVRWTVRICAFLFVLWAVFTSGFLSHVLFGY
jgi:hypothetical protein